MAASPPEPRIRTVPIDEDGVEPEPSAAPRRRMHPTTVIAGVIIVLAAFGLYAGAVAESNREPTIALETTNNEARPLPIAPVPLDTQLLLVVRSEAERWNVVWDPQTGNASTPTFGIVAPRASLNLRGPQDDVSQTYRSSADCDGGCGIAIIATADARERIARPPGQAATWHATLPATLAWSNATADAVAVSYGAVDESGLVVEGTVDNVPLAPDDVVRWYDASGFVTVGNTITAFDTAGDVAWSTTGRLVDITTNSATIVEDTGEWFIVDRVTGIPFASGRSDTGTVEIDIAYVTPTISTTSGASWAYGFELDPGNTLDGTVRIPLAAGTDSELRVTRDGTGTGFSMSFVYLDE